ncbi:hypothetical protein EST38_g5695 [Candolleomyces aberdarensis]|uniref:Uncharacterized protein n=1 Tax=Candolleomyces aberdarensis TaxID=2316362 RepID=A0A4Q2DJV4_9AGAR|nr:hypothetical protein EST38_g5695 [Candolleomyces aberdarensis]
MNSSKMPCVTARSPSFAQPSPSPSSVLSTAQGSSSINIFPKPPPSLADVLNEPGGLMKMKGTIQAIYAMNEVEYDERTVKKQERGYPSRYGKHGERCSTMKLVFKHIGYRIRMIKRGVVRLCRKKEIETTTPPL